MNNDTSPIDPLFTEARSAVSFLDRPVSDEQLQALYALCKWGPTSANCSPMRVVFVRSEAARQRLLPCMSSGNRAKVQSAPVTALIGMDLEFYEQLPLLFPHTDARAWFVGKPEHIATTALRNSSLQGAYLMLAARSLGLDCGPMSGFDAALLEAEFWPGTTVKSNFVCALGHADPAALHPRNPRLTFEQACQLV